MCMFSAPSVPPPPPPPPPPPEPAKKVDPGVQQARTDERNRIAAMAGAASTNKTGGQGLTEAAYTGKTKLGQ